MVAVPRLRLRKLAPKALVERFATARRDVTTLARCLAGHQPPPTVTRVSGARSASVIPLRPTLTWRELRVSRIVRETPDAVSVFLEDPTGAALQYLPGQFLTIEVEVDGEKLRRAYSLSTCPFDGEASVTVKRVEGGRVSNFINDRLAEGDVVRVLGPSGNFTVEPSEDAKRELVLLAGGSGITPVISIAQSVLSKEPESRVTLIYGNRGEGDIIFRERLDGLAKDHEGRFVLDHVLAEPPEGWSGGTGMLDAATVVSRLEALGIEDGDGLAYYVCGPEPMRLGVVEALEGRGVTKRRIHQEIFVRPELQAADDGDGPLPTEPQTVHVKLDGIERTLVVKPEKTILEAGLEAGLTMPFSCAMGGCGACKCKLSDGKVKMEEPNCLTAEEREQGYVLACVSHARTTCRVEVEE